MADQLPAETADPAELPERPESEQMPDERIYTELFGLPSMVFLFAMVAVLKGILSGEYGFAIVGGVAAVGSLLAIGLAMTIAKRD